MKSSNAKLRAIRWFACGMALIAINALIAFLSFDFEFGTPLASRPIIGFVGLEILGGIIYLTAVWGCWRRATAPRLIVWILLAGGLMRLTLLFSAPVLESDFYRYLWDGGVVAHGHSPYAIAPGEAADPRAEAPRPIERLAEDSGKIVRRINYAHLRTIYPPVAQAGFAVAHWIDPWGLAAWRVVILFSELLALILLAALLREIGLPPAALALYWWNPLVVKELVNSAHMDALLLPLVLGAVLCAIRKRHILAALLLALAVGTKLWPIALLPILLRSLTARPRQLAGALGAFGALALALLLPYALAARGEHSGLMAYSGYWEMNDPLFMLMLWGIRPVVRAVGGAGAAAQMTARIIAGVMFCGWVGWLARRRAENPSDLCEKCLLAAAGLFLLSPTQFPWYALWFIPLLAVRPRLSLVVLSVLLPLYYLRFYFTGIDRPEIFDYGVVFAEFVPVWLLLGWEAWTGKPWPQREVLP